MEPGLLTTLGEEPVLPLMRAVLVVGSALVLAVGFQLFVLSRHTTRFAWTIASPLEAATLGAFYLGAFVIAVGSARERSWPRARVAIPGVGIFLWLTLAATLEHLDRFHLHDSNLVARIAAWGWLAIYVVQPTALTVAYVLQLRLQRRSPSLAPCPSWFRAVSAAAGLLMTGFGVALFAAPATIGAHWAWPLTPLTAQALAAWIIAAGLLLLARAVEGDWPRLAVSERALVVLAALLALAFARYSGEVDWSRVATWGWLAGIATYALLGVFGTIAVRRAVTLAPR